MTRDKNRMDVIEFFDSTDAWRYNEHSARSVTLHKSITGQSARGRGRMYAVIETGGKQYRVEVGQTVDVELLNASVGDQVALERVLLVADEDTTRVGQPTLTGASVAATVVEHTRGPKTISFKYTPKKRYRRKTGHRQDYTRLHIDDIRA